jgi:hypothetical protein
MARHIGNGIYECADGIEREYDADPPARCSHCSDEYADGEDDLCSFCREEHAVEERRVAAREADPEYQRQRAAGRARRERLMAEDRARWARDGIRSREVGS